MPGGVGLVANRPFLGLFGVLLFCAIATCVVASGGVVPDPLALGGAGSEVIIVSDIYKTKNSTSFANGF